MLLKEYRMEATMEPEGLIASESFFWNCLTLKNDCPFFNAEDPKLYYFGIGLLVMYGAFLVILIGDLSFFWNVDKFNDKIEYVVSKVRNKVRKVHMDQRRLMTTRQRYERQLKKSKLYTDVVSVLRGAVLKSVDNQFYNEVHQLTTPLEECSSDEMSHSGEADDSQNTIEI